MSEYALMEFRPKEPVTLCKVKTETVFHCMNILSIVAIVVYCYIWTDPTWTLSHVALIFATFFVFILISLHYINRWLAAMLFHYTQLCVGVVVLLCIAEGTTASAYHYDTTGKVAGFAIFGKIQRDARNPYVQYGFAGITLAYLISYIYYMWLSFSLIKNTVLLNYVKKVREKLDSKNVKVEPCMENLISGSNLNNNNSVENYQPKEPRTFFGFRKHYALVCLQFLLIAAFYIYFGFYKKSGFDRYDYFWTFIAILVPLVYIKNIISLMMIHLSFTSIVMWVSVVLIVFPDFSSPSYLHSAFIIGIIYYLSLCYSLIKYALIKQHINKVMKDSREKETTKYEITAEI